MKLLNLGCGFVRPEGRQWVHLDNLYAQFPEGSAERDQLDETDNYVNADIMEGLPFSDEFFDGVVACHVLEHFDAWEGLDLLKECSRVMKSGAPILLSVPDAGYFRSVYAEDRNENWKSLFGVNDPKNPIPTFFEAALWFEEHKAILTQDSLWAYLTRAGFEDIGTPLPREDGILGNLSAALNRHEFSAVLCGRKQ